MDWRSLAHNRWTWVTVAGGAAAGGVALWWRKRKGGTSSAAAGSPTASDTAGSSGGVGYFDSTGTDVAQQLGQYGQAVDQQLTQASQQWQQQYDAFTSAVQAKLDQFPTEAPATTSYVTVQEGNQVDPILAQIRAYKPNFTLSDLEALNPEIRVAWANGNGYISPSNPDRGGAVPIFNVGTSAQVKLPAP